MQTIEQENQNLLRNGYPPLADIETLHTPGPWELSEHGIIRGRDGMICPFICQVQDDHNDEETQANARLISAAPDMFDALRAIVDAFGDQDSLLIDQCKAALAKAEGRAK